jgi:hypothetical protein
MFVFLFTKKVQYCYIEDVIFINWFYLQDNKRSDKHLFSSWIRNFYNRTNVSVCSSKTFISDDLPDFL